MLGGSCNAVLGANRVVTRQRDDNRVKQIRSGKTPEKSKPPLFAMPAGSSGAAVQRTSTATTNRESGSRLFVTTRRVPEVRNENDRTGGVQSNTCPICGKVFSTTYGRRRHVFSHTGERPHECPACDSKFVRKEYLRLHWRRHTGEKPYGCHLCPNDFARKDTLARHIRSLHERAKPHRCADCGRQFARKYHVSVHRRRRVCEK